MKRDTMPEAENQALMEKIYAEILNVRKELDEIKSAIIGEVEPDEDEIEAYHIVRDEVSSGKYSAWSDVKKESGIE